MNSLYCLPSEGFASGSADGTVCLWDSSFSFVTQLDLRKSPDGYPTLQVRSVCWDGGKILAGTRDSEVFQVVLQNRDSPACVMQVCGGGRGREGRWEGQGRGGGRGRRGEVGGAGEGRWEGQGRGRGGEGEGRWEGQERGIRRSRVREAGGAEEGRGSCSMSVHEGIAFTVVLPHSSLSFSRCRVTLKESCGL